MFGIIYFPVLDEYFWARTGAGAYLNNQKISVSDRPIEQALYMVGLLYKDGERKHSTLIVEKSAMLKSMTCSTFCTTQLARGDAEIYAANTFKLVDVCAGIVIAQEAGAVITDKDGSPWTVEAKRLIVTNPACYDEAKACLDQEEYFQAS